MSQIIVAQNRYGIVLAAEKRAVQMGEGEKEVELHLDRLFPLTQNSGLIVAGAAERVEIGKALKNFIEEDKMTDVQEIFGASLPFLSTEYELHLRDSLSQKYATLVYNGYWFSPVRLALQTLIDSATSGVTGVARMKLYKGGAIVAGRKAEQSLYHPDFATFEEDTVYDQKDGEGFIKINALRLKIKSMVDRAAKPKANKKAAPAKRRK